LRGDRGNMRKVSLLLVLIISITLIVGTAIAAEKKTVGVMIWNIAYQFQAHMTRGMQQEAEEYKDEIEFVFVDGQEDLGIQLSQAENFATQQVDAVIYVPGDLEGSKPVVDLLTGAGIPVIGVNTEVAEMDKLISWIGSPIVQSGELLMQGIADVLGGKGNIVELHGAYGHMPQIGRHQGIMNVLENYPNIKVIYEDTANWSRAEAMTKMENILRTELRDQVDAVVAHNDEMAIGAMKAVEETGLLDKIAIGGIDATPEMLQFLKEGKVEVTVFQDAIGQGRKAVEVAAKVVHGEPVESYYWIPYELVKPEDADKYLARYEVD